MARLEVTIETEKGDAWSTSTELPDTVDLRLIEKAGLVDAILTALEKIIPPVEIDEQRLQKWTENLSPNQKAFLKLLCTKLEVTLPEALNAVGKPTAKGTVIAGITANLHRRANKYKMPLPYTKFKKEQEHAWKIEKAIAEKILPLL